MLTLGISSEDFYSLTPVQISIAFHIKTVQKEEELNFQMYQTRLVNYYSIVAMNGTKEFDSPEKLYKLPNEEDIELSKEQYDYLLQPIAEEDIAFLQKLKAK